MTVEYHPEGMSSVLNIVGGLGQMAERLKDDSELLAGYRDRLKNLEGSYMAVLGHLCNFSCALQNLYEEAGNSRQWSEEFEEADNEVNAAHYEYEKLITRLNKSPSFLKLSQPKKIRYYYIPNYTFW